MFCAPSFAPSFSIPGSDMAIFLNRDLTLWPAFAEVSINIIDSSVARAVASSSVTWLRKVRCGSEWRFKHTVCQTSLLCFRRGRLSRRCPVLSEHHLSTSMLTRKKLGLNLCQRDSRRVDCGSLVMSNTTMATEESRI